jgi:flagellin
MNAHRQLGIGNAAASKSMEKLSSGYRINRAGDDAAGLAISEKMRGQIRGLNQASRNAQDGISFIQTAEGALNETQAILQRMRELAVQSSNDTNIAVDRDEIQKEIDQLAQEITRIANDTEFNQQTLLNGGITNTKFHIGANEGQDISLAIGAMDAFTLGVAGSSTTATVDAGATSITNATVSGTKGEGIVDGATITVSTASNTGIEASGTLDVNENTITAKAGAAGTALNGFTIIFGADSDAAAEATFDAGTNTVTITADWDNDKGAAPANLAALAALIQDADTSLASVTLSGDGTFNAADFESAGSIVLGGGEAAGGQVVTLTDGTLIQTVAVADGATSVNVTSGYFQGLSFTTDDITEASGDITLEVTGGSAAVIAADGSVTTEATAGAGIDVSTQTAASSAITTINDAIEKVSTERSKLGAMQNRLEYTIKNLDTSAENLQASESRIRDVDMAKEMMEFTKNNILQQAAQAMLAQANQQPQGVLQLLR